MFLAHPAMREWAHGVATRLSGGLSLADPSTHGQVALAQLQVDLETRLRAAGVFQRSEDDTWCGAALACALITSWQHPCHL